MRESPAISPQTATGLPARSPALMSVATSWAPRAIARVYWIRALVPIDRKASAWTKGSIAIAMAGTSTMAPTSICGAYAWPRASSSRRADSIAALVATTSCMWAIIGISRRTGP
ncbi:hypothetical protein G6F50_016494 [Rhizopus delemar]|uniref:Uncharacterized protein n=1 Tax=Rhizopus delemar TaxID=936053 RepID=A0A9P6XSX5_9FUNG|nr:hypothetical protein G6F50_016494 [Rhizopus delemar]